MRLLTNAPRTWPVWLAVLQMPFAIGSDAPFGSFLRLMLDGGIAGLIHKFGASRAELQHAKQDVALQIAQVREEAKERDARLHDRLDGIDRRLDALQKTVSVFQEHRVIAERWQGGVDSTVAAHERRLEQLEQLERSTGVAA